MSLFGLAWLVERTDVSSKIPSLLMAARAQSCPRSDTIIQYYRCKANSYTVGSVSRKKPLPDEFFSTGFYSAFFLSSVESVI